MRRNWFVAAIVIGVASIAIAALLMRLTADDESSPSASAWADSVCTSLGTWKSSIESLADVSTGTLNAETLAQKIDAAEEATATLVTELRDLGPPDLESGDTLEQELSAAADELQSSVGALKQGAEQASEAASPQEFPKALAALAPQFQALLDRASATVDDLQNADLAGSAKAELQAAFADAESCQALTANG